MFQNFLECFKNLLEKDFTTFIKSIEGPQKNMFNLIAHSMPIRLRSVTHCLSYAL